MKLFLILLQDGTRCLQPSNTSSSSAKDCQGATHIHANSDPSELRWGTHNYFKRFFMKMMQHYVYCSKQIT